MTLYAVALGEGPTRVVFCTYHSLGRATDAQEEHKAPAFDLAIADEAHRTTGTLIEGRATRGREVNFQEFHDDVRLRAYKRLYMTATPRLYTERSKGRLAAKGITVVDFTAIYPTSSRGPRLGAEGTRRAWQHASSVGATQCSAPFPVRRPVECWLVALCHFLPALRRHRPAPFLVCSRPAPFFHAGFLEEFACFARGVRSGSGKPYRTGRSRPRDPAAGLRVLVGCPRC